MAFRRASFNSAQAGMIVEIASSPQAIAEAQALRHQVFCLERGFLVPDRVTNLEQDAFDAAARHVIIRRTSDGEVVATSRVVGSRTTDRGVALPMLQYCSPTVLRGLSMERVGEISRFAISKHIRGRDTLSGPAIRLLLLRGILQVSQAMDLTHWCALMDPSLMRLLSLTGVEFTPVGPLVDCRGLRQPCVAQIEWIVADGRRSHPHYYDVVTREQSVAA